MTSSFQFTITNLQLPMIYHLPFTSIKTHEKHVPLLKIENYEMKIANPNGGALC